MTAQLGPSRTLRALVTPPWRSRLIALIALAVVAAVVLWYLGMDPWHAAAVIGVIVAIGVVWLAVPERPSMTWTVESSLHDDGNRSDVDRLSWSLRTRRGQVRPDAVRRVRRLAASRLAIVSPDADNPLDLDRPADRAAIEQMLGGRAYRTLRPNPVRQPSFHDIEQCLDVLSTLVRPGSVIADPPARLHRFPTRKSTL